MVSLTLVIQSTDEDWTLKQFVIIYSLPLSQFDKLKINSFEDYFKETSWYLLDDFNFPLCSTLWPSRISPTYAYDSINCPLWLPLPSSFHHKLWLVLLDLACVRQLFGTIFQIYWIGEREFSRFFQNNCISNVWIWVVALSLYKLPPKKINEMQTWITNFKPKVYYGLLSSKFSNANSKCFFVIK